LNGLLEQAVCRNFQFPPAGALVDNKLAAAVKHGFYTSKIARHFDQEVRQSFGYHNSPTVKNDQPREFFEATDSLRNSRAWIEEMEDRPGWNTGDNSPIALTFGLSESHCGTVQDRAKLRGAVLRSIAPQPDAWWCSVMFDNGSSGC